MPADDVASTTATESAGDEGLSMDVLAEADAGTLRWAGTARRRLHALARRAGGAGARAPRGAAHHRVARGPHRGDRRRADPRRDRLLAGPSAPGHADALAAFRFANRVMALQENEGGYSSASLSERIYAGRPDDPPQRDPRNTAAPDATAPSAGWCNSGRSARDSGFRLDDARYASFTDELRKTSLCSNRTVVSPVRASQPERPID